MGMRYLGLTHLASEQTRSFPTLEHWEDNWRHNDTSERIYNHK